MKLTEITSVRPIVIDLVNQLIAKDIPVFFTMVGHKQRRLQRRVIRVSLEPDVDDDITRYSLFYTMHDKDPSDTSLNPGEVGVTDRHFAAANLSKQKDRAWLLDIPSTPFDELPVP